MMSRLLGTMNMTHCDLGRIVNAMISRQKISNVPKWILFIMYFPCVASTNLDAFMRWMVSKLKK
jgi:hypothetical protein